MKKSDFIKEHIILIFMIFFVAITGIFALLCVGTNIDEYEHIYSAVQITWGLVPYRDFFQHHHPLLWYVLTPIAYLFKESAFILYAGRLVIGIFIFITCLYIYTISRFLQLSVIASFASVFIYLSSDIVTSVGFQIRPDVPMICCYVAGFYYFLTYLKNQKFSQLNISFILFLISILFLQKIVLLLIPIFFVVLFLLHKQKIKWAHFLKALMMPSIIGCIFLGYFIYTCTFKEYFELNWLLNAAISKAERYSCLFGLDFLYILVATLLTLYGLFRIHHNQLKNIVFFIAVMNVLLLAVVPTPYFQYWLPVYPLLSVGVSFFIFHFIKEKQEIATFVLVMPFFIMSIGEKTNWNQFKKNIEYIQFTLDHTTNEDVVLDFRRFNIHRKNAFGYYWFVHHSIVLLDYKKFHRYPLPDMNELMYKMKPAIIYADIWESKFDDQPVEIEEEHIEDVAKFLNGEYKFGLEKRKNILLKKRFILHRYPIVQKYDQDYLNQNYTEVFDYIYLRNDRLTEADKKLIEKKSR